MSRCKERRDLLEGARADKLDPSIIGEDLLHRRGGAQRAAIPACERCSFPRCDRWRTTGSYLQPRPIPGTERIVSSSMKVSCPRRRVIFSRRVSYVIGIRSATELQNRITRRLP